VYPGLDFLAYSATLQQLENENEELKKENEDMKKKLASVVEKDVVAKSKRSPVKKRQSLKTKNKFSAECVATSTT
jgi:regulator of replication initiation timing